MTVLEFPAWDCLPLLTACRRMPRVVAQRMTALVALRASKAATGPRSC
jgi:hypothetical protein